MADLKAQLELTADASGVEAGVNKAKRSIKGLGDSSAEASSRASRSIDNYIKKLETQNATFGKSAREVNLYRLKLKGASDEQLRAADSALRMKESLERQDVIAGKVRMGAAAIATAAVAAGTALLVMTRNAIDALDALNDVADATGSSVENISALEDVAKRTGANLDTVSTTLVKFNEVLRSVDGENEASKILQKLGLDAEELKRIDPAEALQQTALALTKFADNGDKARAVQELFGKSVKEVAPFLKDLADQGQLNAKVTSEQAAEADKFNKNLAVLKTNIGYVGKAIANTLLPTLNELFERFNRAREAGQGFGDSLARAFGISEMNQALKNPYDALAKINAEIEKIEGGKGGRNQTFNQRRLAVLKKDAAELQLVVDGIQAKLDAPADVAQPSVGTFTAPKATKSAAKISTKISEEDKRSAEFIAEAMRIAQEESEKALKLQQDIILENFKAAESYKDLIDPTRAIGREMQKIQDLVDAGALTSDEGFEAEILKLKEAYKGVGDEVGELDQVTKNFMENVQKSFGDTLYDAMTGNFKNIGDSFKNMIFRMLADAAAANISKSIFGANGANVSGFLNLFSGGGNTVPSAKGNVFGTGQVIPFANGGAFTNSVVSNPTMAPMALFGEAGPEAIMPLQRGPDGRLGVASSGGGPPSINYAPVIQIDSRADRQQVMADVQKAVRQGNAELVEKLQRQGRI